MKTERIWPTRNNLNDYLNDYPEHRQRYDLVSGLISNLDCADVSCGAGYGAYLMGTTAKSVKGFDISLEALDYANNHFLRKNVSFHNIERLESQKFEFIASFETIEHMSEKDGDKFLKKIASSMNPNSKLIISTPLNETKYKENVTEFHIREYSNHEFKSKLQNNGFNIEKWYGQSNIVSERLSKEVMSISMIKILNTGLHRLIPSIVRRQLSKFLLKKNPDKVNPPCKLIENNLNGAFCQIAICQLK